MQHESTTTAKDTCGEHRRRTTAARRARPRRSTRLAPAYSPPTGLTWSSGVGTVFDHAVVTETDNLTVDRDGDANHGRQRHEQLRSTRRTRLCHARRTTQPCEWKDNGGKITVNCRRLRPSRCEPRDRLQLDADASPAPAARRRVGGALVNINPRYDDADPVGAIAVTLTYKKSATGNGSASNFDVCYRKDNVTMWTVLEQCASTSPDPRKPRLLHLAEARERRRPRGRALDRRRTIPGRAWANSTDPARRRRATRRRLDSLTRRHLRKRRDLHRLEEALRLAVVRRSPRGGSPRLAATARARTARRLRARRRCCCSNSVAASSSRCSCAYA